MDQLVDVNTLFGPLPGASTDLSMDELPKLMARHSISVCCAMSTVGMLLDHSKGNAATIAACRDYPGLAPVATVNPIRYFGGDGPVEQFIEEGFKLMRFFPEAQGWPLRFAPFDSLLHSLSARHLPLMVDVHTPGMITEISEMMRGVDCRVILAGVSDRQAAEAIAVLRAHRGFYVETSGLAAAGAIKLLVAGAGADRVLFGSAAPAQPLGSAVAAVRHSGLSEADQALVLGDNARAILNL